jgi:thiamine kinase-like enzyme
MTNPWKDLEVTAPSTILSAWIGGDCEICSVDANVIPSANHKMRMFHVRYRSKAQDTLEEMKYVLKETTSQEANFYGFLSTSNYKNTPKHLILSRKYDRYIIAIQWIEQKDYVQGYSRSEALALTLANLHRTTIPRLNLFHTWSTISIEEYYINFCWREKWRNLVQTGVVELIVTNLKERLERSVVEVLDAISRLDRGYSQSVIHGDLHPGHVLWSGNDCKLIDFDRGGIGTFFLDIAGVFDLDNIETYWHARNLHRYTSFSEFAKTFSTVSRLVGFKYITSFMDKEFQSARRIDGKSEGFQLMLEICLNGK